MENIDVNRQKQQIEVSSDKESMSIPMPAIRSEVDPANDGLLAAAAAGQIGGAAAAASAVEGHAVMTMEDEGASLQQTKDHQIDDEMGAADETVSISVAESEAVKRGNGSRKRSRKNKEAEVHQCDTCGKTLSSRQSLMHHLRSHSEDKKTRCPFQCDECGLSISHKNNLKSHKVIHQTDLEERQRFECQVCGKRLVSNSYLKTHTRNHADSVEVRCPFKCEACPRRFPALGKLNEHKTIHLPEDHWGRQLLKCDVCQKFFGRRHTLARHKLTHLDENDPVLAEIKSKFTCGECGRPFTSAGSLNAHAAHVHLEDDDPLKKTFQCKICTKSFGWANSFRRHMKSHPDVESQ